MRERLRKRLWSALLDLLLLLPALLVVLVEHVLWAGSRRILRTVGALSLVRAAHLWLALLPPVVAVPLFLVPEVFSHASEVGTAVLLAKGHFWAATLLAILGKGLATLILVWIYQACEPALLRVRWFARMHDAVLGARRWLLRRVAPARQLLISRLMRNAPATEALGSRFRAWRLRLASGIELAWPRR